MAQKLNSCKEVALRLQSFLDGELDDNRMEQIRVHLDACIDCGYEADTYRQIKQDLGTITVEVDPDALARLKEFSGRIADQS